MSESFSIIDLAEQYLPGALYRVGGNVYGLKMEDGSFTSLRIFSSTDSFFWYSEGMFGRSEQFLRYIVKLPSDQVDELYPELQKNEFLSILKRMNGDYTNDTGFTLQDVTHPLGYNDYLQNERWITEETANHYGLEISPDNDIYIPLHDIRHRQRVGSLVRSAHTNDKWARYRTLMIGSHDKPYCWPSWELDKVNSDTVFVIVEGVFSLLRMFQTCFKKTSNVILLATLTNHFDQDLYKMLYDFPLILIPDNDEGGSKILKQCTKYKQQGGKIETYLMTDDQGLPVMLDEVDDETLIGLMRSVCLASKFTIK